MHSPSSSGPFSPADVEDTHSLRSFGDVQSLGQSGEDPTTTHSLIRSQSHRASLFCANQPHPLVNTKLDSSVYTLPHAETEGQVELVEAAADLALDSPVEPPGPWQLTGLPFFAPWTDDEIFDVFDLELAISPGSKDLSIDVRCRNSSSSSSSGRPTYKISGKTRPANFLIGMGRKNMNIDVARSLAWDVGAGAPISVGQKGLGYSLAFTTKDQSAKDVSLFAAHSVLAKSALASVLHVSHVCGTYDACSPLSTAEHREGIYRESLAHHYFALPLNDMGVPTPTGKKRSARPSHVPPTRKPNEMPPYEGGGYFIFEASSDEQQIVTTLYCSGYEQRAHSRIGDVKVAELRIRPAATSSTSWVRLFKERHAALHISRRGLACVMTGPHVRMDLQTPQPGKQACLSRGQAIEVVLGSLATAIISVHDGGLAKKWAWLSSAPQSLLPPHQMPTRGPGRSKTQPVACDTEAGFESTSDSGSSDGSPDPPTASTLSLSATSQPNASASGRVFGLAHSEGTRPHAPAEGGLMERIHTGVNVQDLHAAAAGFGRQETTGPPHLPLPQTLDSNPSSVLAATAGLAVPPRKHSASPNGVSRSDSPVAKMFVGTWRRKAIVKSKETKPKLKADNSEGTQSSEGAKSDGGNNTMSVVSRQTVFLLDREKKLPVPLSHSPAGFSPSHSQWPPDVYNEDEAMENAREFPGAGSQQRLDDDYIFG
ncbi:hypothetical protein HMN09_00166000 [Mycena chlorophos]|uniref:Uncharacterized protein n=1 Tax=Mycena chlorophos TaxID=658473 RepID=A0A8H6TP48_MYCCL|nr:hypothetical protein HMN09_00166000 [Mycena chlorophos]